MTKFHKEENDNKLNFSSYRNRACCFIRSFVQASSFGLLESTVLVNQVKDVFVEETVAIFGPEEIAMVELLVRDLIKSNYIRQFAP